MAKTTIIQKTGLPEFLPHGWKKEVATLLGIHVNTVTNSLKRGKGYNYEKIKLVAVERWGKINNTGNSDE